MASLTAATTDKTFQGDVLDAERLVLVDFWADWCAPCKTISPALDQLALKHADKLKVVKVDVASQRATASRYGVSALPTFVVFKGGKEVARHAGVAGGIQAIEKLVLHAI